MDLFLQPVNVNRFSDSQKVFQPCPYRQNTEAISWRKLVHYENANPDDVYHIIGVTSVKEGFAEYTGSEEGYTFRHFKSHKVYIVAKSVGRRYKVLPEDLRVLSTV